MECTILFPENMEKSLLDSYKVWKNKEHDFWSPLNSDTRPGMILVQQLTECRLIFFFVLFFFVALSDDKAQQFPSSASLLMSAWDFNAIIVLCCHLHFSISRPLWFGFEARDWERDACSFFFLSLPLPCCVTIDESFLCSFCYTPVNECMSKWEQKRWRLMMEVFVQLWTEKGLLKGKQDKCIATPWITMGIMRLTKWLQSTLTQVRSRETFMYP